MGRTVLHAGEILCMQKVEWIVVGFYKMIASKDRAKWTHDNPELAKLFYELGEKENGG